LHGVVLPKSQIQLIWLPNSSTKVEFIALLDISEATTTSISRSMLWNPGLDNSAGAVDHYFQLQQAFRCYLVLGVRGSFESGYHAGVTQLDQGTKLAVTVEYYCNPLLSAYAQRGCDICMVLHHELTRHDSVQLAD
jgi:hypothetical protein